MEVVIGEVETVAFVGVEVEMLLLEQMSTKDLGYEKTCSDYYQWREEYVHLMESASAVSERDLVVRRWN